MNFIYFTPLSPVFLHIWPIQFHYYGLMYVISFIIWYKIISYILNHNIIWMSNEKFDNLYYSIIIWWLIWWRLWHILFYELSYYIQRPIEILFIWNWWMASHGGFIWWLIAFLLFKPRNIKAINISDIFLVPLPIWLALGRLGNLINWEIYGYATSVPWCMHFSDRICRHPTQIYAIIKDIIVFLVVIYIFKYHNKPWNITSAFLITYWTLRIIVECFKETFTWNNYLSYITTWQILSIIMIIIWISIFFIQRNKKHN